MSIFLPSFSVVLSAPPAPAHDPSFGLSSQEALTQVFDAVDIGSHGADSAVALLSSAILVFGQRVDLLERVFCLCGHCGKTQLQSSYWRVGEAVDDGRA